MPNPTSGFTTIENKGQATLTITDIRGRVVKKTEINGKYSLDLTEYNSGIYFVTILSNDKLRTEKIIKN
ncbi:MAG: T9SS type A sorting domain-containing protein [Bacteroidetes bacterium]|nr:T9SS type A sorting domain-containing protein [Bacteroidota bacterium]